MWTLSIERQLATGTSLEVNYVGTKGTHLDTRTDANQPYPWNPAAPSPPAARLPYPNIGIMLEGNWGVNSIYNALNVKVEHRRGDLLLMAAYTWSRAMDTVSASAGLSNDFAGWVGPIDNYNFNYDRAPSSFNAPQRLVSSFVYSLPVGKGKRFLGTMGRPADLILGGWQVNGIVMFQHGFPFAVSALDEGNLLGLEGGNRADIVGNPHPSGFKFSRVEAFNTAAFAQPAAGYFGTSARNMISSPGINNWNMSLFKNIPVIPEKLQLQLRLESFNTWNHTQFGQPDSGVEDSTFGVIGSAQPQRIDQIAAKLIW
jgi:hypothetical protein